MRNDGGGDNFRKFGISLVGSIPWGTHLCQFYESKQDLVDILVPYFAEGLRNKEFCMWVTSKPLEVEEAKKALRSKVPDLDDYFSKGQIEIISYDNWYLLNGKFDSDRVLQGWVEKEKAALEKGFEGLRLTGNTFWIERELWNSFVDYEEAVNSVIGNHRMIAVCTYCLTNCSGTDVLDVVRNHIGTLVKQGKKWYLVEDSARRKAANGALKISEQKYAALFKNMQDGFAYHKILLNHAGKPVDYVFLEVNDAFEQLTGLKSSDILGKRVTEVLPGMEKDPADWIGVYGDVALTGKPVKFENYSQALDKWYSVSAYSPQKEYFVATFEDITSRKKAEVEVAKLASFPRLNPNPILEVDVDCNICYSNQAAESTFPDLKGNALNHPFLSDWKSVLSEVQKSKDHDFSRELKVGNKWFYQNFFWIPENQNIRIYSINIDEVKLAEKKIRESEQRWATTLSSIGDAVISTDLDGRITFMNRVAEELTGYSLKEALEAPLKEVFHIINEQTREEVEDPVTKVLEKGLIVGLANHTILVQKDKTEVAIDDSGAPIRDENGKIRGVVLVFRNISENKKFVDALVSAKTEWERTFDSVPDLIAILDNNHKIVRANQAMAQRLGATPEDCIGLSCYECVHGTTFPIESCPHSQTMKDGQTHIAEVHEERLGGAFLVSTTPLKDEQGHMIGSVHVARNITARKKTEDALRESEKRLSRSQEIAHLGSWELDLKNNKLTWSDEVYRIFGLKPQEFGATYEAFLEAVHPEDRALVNAAYAGSLRDGKDSYEIEHRVMRKLNGEIRFVYEKCEHQRDKSGKIIRSIGMVQDITERKQIEEELLDTLKASQRRQQEVSALLEASKAVLIHREFIKAANSIFGSCKDLLGANAGYVALISKDGMENQVLFLDSGGFPCQVDPALPMPIRGLRAEAYKTGKVIFCNDFSGSNWVDLLPDGHVKLRNVLFAPLAIDKKTVGIIGLANKPTAFTERDAQMASAFGEIASIALINSQMLAELEEKEKLLKAHSEHLQDLVEEKTRQLRNSERLAAIGQTAGMVGHDIRNPLQSITGDVYLAKVDLASCPDNENKASVQESLEAIEKNVEYINKIVADLQDFAKPLNPVFCDVNLRQTIDELLSSKGIPLNIEVSSVVEKSAESITADSAYIKRILNNLFSNAIQAMPKGGNLRIHAYREAEDLVLTVEDTGVGIPEEVKPKLFQPLFTTKSRGQGFGLPVVKRMTEALKGTVSVESQFGKGTKFILRFPFASGKK